MTSRCLVGLVALGLALGVPPGAHAQSRPLHLRLGVHTSVLGAPDVIAIRQGYFRQEGLEVEWRRFALGKEGRDAMIAGAIDVNATAPTPFLIGLEKGVPYTGIAINSYFCGTNHVVVRKDSDINSVAQLKGKRIGLPKGTITEYVFATRIAPAHGLKPGDYEIANIPDAKDRVPSLVAKAIDAASVNDPFVAAAEHDGLIRSIENYCKYDPLPFVVTATNKIVKDNPDAVVAYLRGWLRAIKLLQDEPLKAAAVYADEQKSLGREVPVAVLDRALRRMKWAPEITREMEQYLADQAKDLVAGAGEGRLKAVPDIPKALNKELLRRASPGR
ncbi:MAG TPA: NrtA/SsuA/CpmA family ABC transporter substrate-binding protein [Methylomirabilota bacterium]|jgi:NitT/TauT family transport system substrate-binding protein|nr:NrtA/SsuA/CpmA family ABC transporter substrate-binding protein [Methylomirabilota bacterium]